MSLVKDITQNTSFVPEDMPLNEVAILVADSGAGVVGVTRDGRAVGTVTKDVLEARVLALGRDISSLKAKHVMEHRPITIEWLSDDSDLIDTAILMRRNRTSNAIVIRGGLPVGVVSYGALSRYNLGDLA